MRKPRSLRKPSLVFTRWEVVQLLSADSQTTYMLHPPFGSIEGEARVFGEGRRDNGRLAFESALAAQAR
jgi:hypothetical protein